MIDGVIFNAYPDSCGETLADAVKLLSSDSLKGAFSCFYLLPTMFQSDLDRGFSIQSYDLNDEMVQSEDLEAIKKLNIELLLDFVLNHLSVQSPQFRNLLEKGDKSEYIDFFIDWNKFWEGRGDIGDEGFIIPRDEYLSRLFLRKPGLPLIKIHFPDGTDRFYWNTFYQEIRQVGDKVTYLGQMDLNGESENVWNFYRDSLAKFRDYGAEIVRLDAFAYLHKEAGKTNFFNEPGTWNYLDRLKKIADQFNLKLLPEIHSKHEDGIHQALAEQGFPFYDFFFPGLIIHTIETRHTQPLLSWIDEILKEGYKVVNMLGCHDGIPVLDVQGLLDDDELSFLISLMQERGGRIKDLYGPDGKRIAYYQVNSTFYSAFGEDEGKFLLARAIQLFMPGTPLIWYLDLFGGTNNYTAADHKGHKEINRTNLSLQDINLRLKSPLVCEQIKLIRFRNSFPAFKPSAMITAESEPGKIVFRWENGTYAALLDANIENLSYRIKFRHDGEGWKSLD